MSSYCENLVNTVIDLSESNDWVNAVKEWEIIDCYEDETLCESCVCGKERLKYLFTIQNVINQNTLYPIGSSCIKKFNRTDLSEQTAIQEKLFKLLHMVEHNEFLSLNSELFSRKLLKYFYENNVFKPNEYNHYSPENDYNFLLKMFNARTNHTINEKKKITAILLQSIKPYLQDILKDKIIKH